MFILQQLNMNMQDSETTGKVTFHCNKFKPCLFNIVIGEVEPHVSQLIKEHIIK